jgi:hypothetical protein
MINIKTLCPQDKAILEIAKKESYIIKNLRTFKGMEGMGGFNATLYRLDMTNHHKILVAHLINDDSGGETNFVGINSMEMEKLRDLCKTVPSRKVEDVEIKCDPDIFVCTLISNLEAEKYWCKKCKYATIVFLKNQKPEEYTSYSKPYSPEWAATLREKLGDTLLEIVNERYL